MDARRKLCLPMLALMLAGCAKEAEKPEPVKQYALHGEVLELESKDKLAKIKHEKIGDWMGAMTMEFPVKDEKEFADLKVGEKIDATVNVQGLNYWVADIHPQPEK